MKEAPAEDSNSLDQVRHTQNIPQSGGVLQGQRPQVKNDDDALWAGILKSTGASNKLP